MLDVGLGFREALNPHPEALNPNPDNLEPEQVPTLFLYIPSETRVCDIYIYTHPKR